MLKIKHHSLEASINPIGAELSSLRNDGSELIWHGDASFWNGRAPILFPIVGALKDGKMTHNGQAYEMPRHGIARRATFKCIERTDATLCMSLKADDTTLAVYPWQFELQVNFSLSDSGIEICYVVLNHDENDLLFTIGSHPAFALKIDNNHQFEDYAIGFNKAESFASYALDDAGLLATQATPFETQDKSIVLSKDIFNQDALVLRDINSNRINLQCKGKTLLSVNTGGAPHLGLWSKPGAPFVCIEPWLGTSDFIDSNGEFASKPDLASLKPGDSFSHAIEINLPHN